MKTYAETFREEGQELLAELEEALIALEEDPTLGEPVDRVFRVLHTLKGSGAMSGFEQTATLAHEIESIFELVRSGMLTVSSELISLTLSAHDLLTASLHADLTRTPLDPALKDVLLNQLYTLAQVALGKHAETTDDLPAPAPPQRGSVNSFLIRFRPHAHLLMRGIEPTAIFRALSDIGAYLIVGHPHDIPPLEEIDPELCHIFWDLLVVTETDINAVRDVFIFVEDDSDLTILPIKVQLPLHCETSSADFRSLLARHGTLSAEELVNLLETGKVPDAAPSANNALENGSRAADAPLERSASIRVKSERLDNLVNLIGELVTIQARLSQTVAGRKDAALETLGEEIERLTWELRDEVLFIRMLPLGATFTRIKRMVRDLSAELGKEVELVVEGADTELDKTVIERLQDPLVHLLRNAVDHGIETPQERIAAGKAASGTIRISAGHNGPRVVLTVVDNGRGLNPEVILHRAQQSGLVDFQQQLSEREIFQLIFTPGFSTASEVTSVSGRGVGMDVVRRAIESLRGTIDVSSTPGAGTTFTITLPLTLAIIDGLLVDVGQDRFVVPLAAVEECVELSREDVARSHGRQVTMLRGELIPYIRLRDHFGCQGTMPRIEQIVVTNHDGERIGLVVDKVIGSHQTVIKSMGGALPETTGFSGATILGNGRVALIIDISQLIGDYAAGEPVALTHSNRHLFA